MTDTARKIEQYLKEQETWKRANHEIFRAIVHEVEPSVAENWKWSVPVFSIKGKDVLAISTFKNHTKYNFFHGAKLEDKHHLFNSGLDSKQHRSINLREGESIDRAKLVDLVKKAFDQIKQS